MSSTENNKVSLTQASIAASVLALVTFISFAAVPYAKKVKTHYSPSQFQPRHHHLLQEDKTITKMFALESTSAHLLLLSLPPKHSWLKDEHFAKLKKLTDAISEVKNFSRVISLTNIDTALVNHDSFYVGQLSEILNSNSKQVSAILKDPLVTPRILTSDGRHTAIVLQPRKNLSNQAHSHLMTQIETLASVYIPEAKVQIGGPAAVRTEVTSLLSSELTLFMGLSLLGAIVLLLLVFSGWVAIPITLLMVVAANVCAVAMMTLMGSAFTLLSCTIPILVSMTVIGIAAHNMVRLSDLGALPGRERALKVFSESKRLVGSNLMAAATTVVGFATLGFSDVPLVREYGFTVSAVIPIAALLSVLSLPAFFVFLPLPNPRAWLKSSHGFAGFVVTYKVPLVTGLTALAVISAYLGQELHWKSRMFDDLPKNNQSRKSTDFINQRLGGTIPLEIAIKSPDGKSTWNQAQNIKKLDQLSRRWEKYAGVGNVIGLNDFLRVSQPKQKLPQSNAAIAEAFFVYGMSQDNPLRHYMTPNERATRITVQFRDVQSHIMDQTIKKIRADIASEFPRHQILMGGLAATIHPLNKILSETLIWGFIEAMIIIVLMLSLTFRSWRWAVAAAVPNLLPPAILLGTLALTETPIKPAIAMIFSISLGLAFDNTIYVLGRLREMLKNHTDKTLPVRDLLSRETNPCLVSSLSVIAGFSLFLLSYFNVNKMFGVFMLISVVAGLLGDLVLLPALLQWFPRLLDRPRYSPLLSRPLRLVPIVFFFVLGGTALVMISKPAKAGELNLSADELLKKVEKQNSPPSETTHLKMSIIEPDGSKKEREIKIWRKNSQDSKALVKILEPTDLKGVSLLSVVGAGEEDQWLYLPSARRPRRIVGSNKQGRFLDSELSFEDMQASTYRGFKNKIVKTEGKGKNRTAVIESTAKAGSDSSYSKIKSWINLDTNRVEKVEYYNRANKLYKTMNFSKYRKVGKSYWRAGEIKITNLIDKRSTVLSLKTVDLKRLEDDKFSLSALE